MPRPKTKAFNLKELKKEISQLKDDGEKNISHHKKMLEYYSDWQDRLNKIELKIQEAERDHGINPDDLEEVSVLEDLLG